jgi:D-aminopeptidase
MRARELGLTCGTLPPGPRNLISDVPGVRVGHATLIEGGIRTGVTAVLPHAGDAFRDKAVAASAVLNGFGKSIGLVQVDELGTLETPILLTNTFSVGVCAEALIRRAIAANPAIGRQTSTVNPVVFECNDGYLNDIQAMAVTEAHAEEALETAGEKFLVGAVGAGTGMSCFGLKGGIGSASRQLGLDGATYHLGVLVLANFGRAGDLRLPDGKRVGIDGVHSPEAGSCIIVMATDVPLDHRQLGRVARRAGVGLAWCGAFWGNGSGDIALAFTTANRVPHAADRDLMEQRVLAEDRIDLLFRAAAEATQEAVLDALAAADTMVGRDGHRRVGLREVLGKR